MTTSTESYVSARLLAIAIHILVILQLVTIGLTTMDWAFAAFAQGSESHTAIRALSALTCQSAQFLYWAAFIVFMIWVHRSIANLPALGSMRCRFTPAAAVWGFFIPVVNLVRGYQVMATIWSESQPAQLDDRGVPQPRRTALVNWWWGLYLAHLAVSFAVATSFLGAGHEFAVGLALLNLVRFAVGVMFLVVIAATQRRQDAMWDDLQRQRSVPQPTAQYLR